VSCRQKSEPKSESYAAWLARIDASVETIARKMKRGNPAPPPRTAPAIAANQGSSEYLSDAIAGQKSNFVGVIFTRGEAAVADAAMAVVRALQAGEGMRADDLIEKISELGYLLDSARTKLESGRR
jgi:hypothetical protein